MPSSDEQHKTNSTVSLKTLSHFVFLGHIFILLTFGSYILVSVFIFLPWGGCVSYLYLVAFVCFLEGGMELSREVGRIWEEWGRGKSWS